MQGQLWPNLGYKMERFELHNTIYADLKTYKKNEILTDENELKWVRENCGFPVVIIDKYIEKTIDILFMKIIDVYDWSAQRPTVI